MALITNLVILLVAVLHLYFLVLEMFLWDKPKGMKAFGLTPQKAADTKVLAANQGLYNGFLAAGLLWGLFQGVVHQGDAGLDFKVFFLLCVVVAGVYGALTVSKKILIIQAMPAALALVLLFLSLN
jgi:putative membrane protein